MSKHGSRPIAVGRQRSTSASARPIGKVRSELSLRLRERLPELRAAVATRIYAISDPHGVPDPAYLQGLNGALIAAIDYRLAVLEAGEQHAPAVPAPLLSQARLDARDGVPLDAVLRRYFAGNALFGDFLGKEAARAEVPSSVLRRLLGEQATLSDRLLEAVSVEHAREAAIRPTSAAERRRECVKSLLAGELVDPSLLGYDLDAHHLALMAKGSGGERMMREVASMLGRRLLAVCREEEQIWACWLGGRSKLGADRALRALSEIRLDRMVVTVGEPGEGLSGWRFSHRQAKAALPIAERLGQRVLRYADVVLPASILHDDLSATSLHQLYIEPLERGRDGGKVALATLRAYFAAERNVSSTAAALGVDRRTVRNRIGTIEELLGRPLKGSWAELEIALRLDD